MEARRRAQLTGTNLSRDLARSFEASLKRAFAKRSLRLSASKFAKRLSPFGPNSSDGHGGAAPPLPIPNRIVKRPRADDSGVLPCESRSPSDTHLKRPPPGAFPFYPSHLSPTCLGVAGSSPLAVKRSPFPRCAESAAASETAQPPAERPRRGDASSGSTSRLSLLHSACLLVLFACRMAARVRLAPWFGFALIWVWRAALRPNRGKASAANRRRPSKTRQGAPPRRVARNRRLRAGWFAAARSHGRSVCRTIKRRRRQARIKLCAADPNAPRRIGDGGGGDDESMGAGRNDSISGHAI